MTSLLDRMNVGTRPGPIRSRHSTGSSRSSPYERPARGDIDSQWSHDLFDSHNSLSARLNVKGATPKATFNSLAQKALRDATEGFSIKGASASTQGNVVEVSGLVKGTTPEDVSAIFKSCGIIVNAKSIPGNDIVIRVTFKSPASAQEAVKKFHNQPADGKTLVVKVVGSSTAGTILGGRLGGGDGLGLVRQEGSVDVLLNGSSEIGSKLRSDSLLQTERAQVLVAPPGADPKDYTVSSRGRGGRGGRRGGRAGRGNRRAGLAGRMDVD